MSAENTMAMRSSFSIENILSKPHKTQLTDRQYKSECATECCLENSNTFDEMSSISCNEIVFKEEPPNGVMNDETVMNEDLTNINRSQFASPDSSGCEEENGDNLSDITIGENCECIEEMDFFGEESIVSKRDHFIKAYNIFLPTQAIQLVRTSEKI